MAELYAKPYEVIDTGYNPQQTQQGGQDAEMQSYLESLPPEERQKALERINAPLTGEELALMANSGEKLPTLEEYAEIEKFHKNHEVSFLDGLGKIAEGGEQVMTDLSNAFASMLNDPSGTASKMPATAVEAFAQGTRNFYGMLAQSQNPDSVLFRVKDFLSGGGNIEDRYRQYLDALEFNKKSIALAEGKETWLMDKDMINHEVTQAMAYIADPTLFIPFGKVASTGLRAVGLGEKLTMAGARAAAIKNGIIGNTIKWGAGQPLEFMGGAVRNTIDYGLERAGAAFEATTGIGAKEFAQTARMSGIGFSASAVAGHAVPYASTISDAYLVGSSARGFGEALTLIGDTMKKNQFGRGINSWAAEALSQAEKNGVALSPHAKGLLKTLNAVDPLFAYGWNGLETAAEGSMIGGGLGYLSGGEEGMYSGIGAGIALGAVGGTAGKMVADVTGGTNVARRAVQAKMVIEGHKVTNPEKAMFFQAMQKAAEIRGKDVDLVNGIIAGIDNVAPNFEFHALTPDQFETEAKKRGYNPETGKFMEISALDAEFGADRASKSKAMYVLRSVGGDFVGNRQGFLDALKKASAKDSVNPNKPASNIPLNLRKYTDVAKTFDKLSKTQQEAILKEIDGQNAVATELGGKTKLREYYDALTWSESWTDSIVKKFESNREGARKDIAEMLAQETDKNGKLTSKGRALADKLRAEGFLDRDGKLLRERNLLQADLTLSQFEHSKGALISRESDGKSHMYINLERMGDETFPHELFHTIMRESPMKKHFTDTLVHKLLGTVDKDGNLVRPAEVNITQIERFFKRYIELANRNPDGTLDVGTADSIFKQVQDALTEYRNAGENKKISDKARGLLENYTEEFGAYYFSHWLMGRNRNTLFFGGELKGIEGLVERAKDSFKDFWQSKVSKSNPEFDFSRGLNEAFNRSKGLGRISAMDYYMRDMVRAASNANREVFRPDSMTLENLRDFERSNGLRNLTAQGGTRKLNPREQVTQNIRLGKEAYKILSGLDKNLRTSKDVLDENGKQIITGRLSEAELDALVKGGIVPRAWADKVNQGYAMLDGTVSNIFSAGYLGKTEQTTDASYPRLTGKDVSFKNRKAVLFDVETKIKADGTFYTLFHTLDLAVIEQRANHLWQNVDYRNLWNGDRAAFEADFFKYISNASKASTDATKKDSAALLETGDGNGAKRRDVLHQMAGMALQIGDAYKHQPIAVIPEGIRHSVTTFNIDGMTMPRVETGTRYDINMGNAHKFIRENWQPDEMRQEKTPAGTMMRHESGFKFSVANGKTTAYTSAGKKIGTFDSVKQATEAAKREYHKVYDNIDKAVRESVAEQDKNATKFQPLDENERAEAIRLGDVFALQSMKDFVGNRTLLRQTREEHIYQRALEAIENPEQLLAYAQKVAGDLLKISAEYDRLIADITKKDNDFEGEKNAWSQSYYKKLNELRDVKYGYSSSFEDWKFDQTNKGKWNPPERIVSTGIGMGDLNPEHSKYIREGFARYEADAKAAWAKLTADPEYIELRKGYNQKTAYFAQRAKELIAERDLIDEFKKKNKEALENPLTTALDTLGQYSTAETTTAEKAGMLAKLVEANAKQKDYSGLLETLFASEYDDKIQTGKPFVAVTTHGTGNVELMLARLFAADKLGSHYDIPSSRMGSFSAGSQNTSTAYAKKAPVQDLSTLGISKLVKIHSLKGAELVLNLENNLRDFFGKRYDILKDKANKAAEAYGEHKAYYEQNPHLGNHLANNEKGELLYSEWRSALAQAGHGLSRDAFISSEVRDFLKNGSNESWATQFAIDANKIAKYAVENNLLQSYPDKKMQLRKVIRMDNPYVVVDPRSYEEHHISPHMKRAIAAGHDGIIFKRFADGGQPDNVYVVFKDYMKDNIKVIDTSFDDVHVPRGNDESGRVLKGGKDLLLNFQPTDEAEGGRVYDFNSPKFKSSFIGKYAEENPERLQNKNIEFVKRRDGSYRITMTDNSGATKKIGHITADLDMRVKGEGIAVISSNIDPKFRGNKLANVLYSEMAERLRAMGVKYVDGTIVNPEGIPVQVRNSVIGQTYYKGSNKPAFREDAAKKIQAVQSIYPSKGIDVYNELDFNARYQPDDYQGGDDYYKPKKKPSVKIPDEYKDFPTSPEGVDEFGAKIRYAYYFNPKSGELERVDFPHTYMEIGHEINNKEVYLWSLNNADYRKHGVHENSPITLESMEKMMRNKESPAHGYGKLSLSEVRGRIEMPVYKDGKLVEKGRASIGIVAGGEGKLSAADIRLLKEKIIRKFGVDTISEKDFDFYLYTADKKLRSQFGISYKDRLGIKFQPAEGEQGGRTYTDEQMQKEFIGRYASENPNITKGLKINHGIVIGRMGQEAVVLMKNGEMIGRLTWMTDKQNGHTYDIAVEIEPEYQGKKYQHLLYSEAYERMRARGFKETYQDIYNEQGIPAKSQIKILGKDAGTFTDRNFKQKKLTYDAFMREMKYALKNGDEFVPTEAKLDHNAWYQPDEKLPPTRDQGFNRVYREISRSKKKTSGTIKQSYLDRFGIRLKDYEELVRLEDALYRLEKDYGDGKIDDDSAREQRKDLHEEIEDRKNIIDSDIKDKMGWGVTFEDHNTEIESGLRSINRIIDIISKKPLDKVDELAGSNRLEAVLKKELGSGFAQEIVDEDVFVADAFREYAGLKYEREMIGKAFESELYSSDYITPQKGRHHYTIPASEGANKKGILVDILRSENKLTDKGLPQGEVNPRRIINALRNKSGGDSKVYAEAKAIGLIDWLESKQEGKNQKKVTTKELIEFVENNKMGLEIDPQLEQAADFGSTRPYVTGGEEQAKKGYRVYVVRMTNAKHEHGVAGHFEGAVVHVRVTLRDTKDGKKVMHIEEIQANNTATDVLSESQRKLVSEEIKILYRYRDAREKILNEGSSEVRTINSWNVSSAEKTIAHDDMVKRQTSKLDKLRAESSEKLFDANPEYWKEKFSSNTQRDRDEYIKLVDKYLLSNRESILISEKETSLNNSKNDAPLQDPKEWVKVAFRTVLRKALVEGVDRITITPWSETPLQVGMKAKSAERFYGKTIVDAFNSELQKMNSRLSSTNSSESIPRQRYNDSKLKTNEAIQKVSSAVVPSELTGTKAKELFEVLHKDDADIASNHTPNALESRFSYLLGTIPDGTSGKWEMTIAAQRRLNQFRDYTIMLESQDGGKHPSGLSVKASAADMSESQYLVDRSMGFDLTPEMKKKAARPQRMFQPAEYTEFKSEQSPTGRILRNAKGYVIMMSGNKFRVYNPAKAIIGVYGSEEEAKKRIYREIPKQ